MSANINNLIKHLDRIKLEEAILILDDPLFSGQEHIERITDDLRLKMVWHVLATSQSPLHVPPALPTWLVRLSQTPKDAPMENLSLDTEQAWDAWFDDLKQASCLEDWQLLRLLDVLKQNHEAIYQNIRNLNESIFPLARCPFTQDNLNTLTLKLGINLAQNSRTSEGLMSIRFFRLLIDRLRLLATTPPATSHTNNHQKRDTLQTVLDKHDLPHFTALLLAGADPNIAVGGIPLYRLTLQPQRVDNSLAFFNELAKNHALKLQSDVFELLMNFDCGGEDFTEAVNHAVRKCLPFSLKTWQNIMKRPDLTPHRRQLAQFAKALFPQIAAYQKVYPMAVVYLLNTIFRSTLPNAPELAAPWLRLAPLLDAKQQQNMADTLTQQATQWNPELFQAAVDAGLLSLPDPQMTAGFILFLLRMNYPELSKEIPEELSSWDLELLDSPQYFISENLNTWLSRLQQSQDDTSLCNLIVKGMSRVQSWTTVSILLNQVAKCKNPDFIKKIFTGCMQSNRDDFLTCLEHGEIEQLNSLILQDIIVLPDMDDWTLARILPQTEPEALRRLIDKGLHISYECLIRLAEQGRLDSLREILEDKALLQAQNLILSAELDSSNDNQNLLAKLCVSAASEGQLDVLRYLLELKPELLTSHDYEGRSLLHHILDKTPSCESEREKNKQNYQEGLRLVIRKMNHAYREQNLQVNCVNEDSGDGTPLALVAKRDNLLALQVLLEEKVDLNTGEFSDDGPAILQAGYGKVIEIIQEQQVSIDPRDGKGNYPLLKLDKRIPFKDFKTMLDRTPQNLIRTSNCYGKTILHTYVRIMVELEDRDDSNELEQYLQFLPQLIRDYDLDINAMSNAPSYGERETALSTALTADAPRVVQRLLKLGANIRQVNAKGETLLFDIVDACRPQKALELVKTLVEKHQVNPTQCNYKRQNLLFKLCKESNDTLFNYVRQHGADISQVDNQGHTLLDQALSDGNVPLLKRLLDSGLCFKSTKGPVSQSPEFMSKLLQQGLKSDTDLEAFKRLFQQCLDAGMELNPPVGIFESPSLFTLMEVLNDRTLPLLRFLLDELKLRVSLTDQSGNTLLHEMMRHAEKSTREQLEKVLNYLLAHKDLHLTLSVKNTKGENLLHTAATLSHDKDGASMLWLWERLCQDNPNLPLMQDKEGNTPFFKWLERRDIEDDPKNWDQKLAFWMFRKPPNDMLNERRYNALDVFLHARGQSAHLELMQKLCQAGFTCHDLKVFARTSVSHLTCYVEHALNGNYKALCQQLETDFEENGENLFTEALRQGNADMVVLLLDCGYNFWKQMRIDAFLVLLSEGDAPNLKLLEKCFTEWHWDPQILRECCKDQDGNTINAIELLFMTYHFLDGRDLLKLLSEKLMPGIYTHTDMLRQLLQYNGIGTAKVVEWLVSNGADPCTMSTIKALDVLLMYSNNNTILTMSMEKLNQYAQGRNLPLLSVKYSQNVTTLLHAAIENRNIFPLRYLLQKLHIRIEGENEDHLDPIDYAIDRHKTTHLFWLLEAQKQKLTPDYLARLLSQALMKETNPESPSMECIQLLVERYHANPLHQDDRGRIPLRLVHRDTYLWSYLYDHCHRE